MTSASPRPGPSCGRMLDEDEYRAAARNTLNAHYTDAAFVQAIWAGVQRLGFEGGRVLEAGCGGGNFIGFAPGGRGDHRRGAGPDHRRDRAEAVPRRRHLPTSFADTRAPEGVLRPGDRQRPVRQVRPHRPAAQPRRPQHPQPLHHQEPAPGPAGRPGRRGDRRYTLDARNPAARREIASSGRPHRGGPAARAARTGRLPAPTSSPTC